MPHMHPAGEYPNSSKKRQKYRCSASNATFMLTLCPICRSEASVQHNNLVSTKDFAKHDAEAVLRFGCANAAAVMRGYCMP